jgi:phosphopantothenoylcysteine synthetase/decarboxylase
VHNPGPVLYVVVTGSPAAADTPTFVGQLIDDGWQPCVIASAMGARWLNTHELALQTGHPVRTAYKQPHEPDVLPPADAYVVAPATFNTVNKLANGITDTLAVGVVAEGIGRRRPVVVAPWANRALAQPGAYRRSIAWLTEDNVQLVLTERTRPGATLPEPDHEAFPWDKVRATLAKIKSDLA